jgi:hypothetical protein
MSRAMATWREASRQGGLRSADFTPLPSASPKTTKTPIRILREWHEVKPQRTLYQYVTGLWACAQIVGQSHARRHDGMGCNSVPPAQLAYPRDMSYHTAPAHSCLVCKGLIPEWPKSSCKNPQLWLCGSTRAGVHVAGLGGPRGGRVGVVGAYWSRHGSGTEGRSTTAGR